MTHKGPLAGHRFWPQQQDCCYSARPPLWAGGARVYETGATDVGASSAGRAALAEDASTAFGNPAWRG